jgi:hypothetical protein
MRGRGRGRDRGDKLAYTSRPWDFHIPCDGEDDPILQTAEGLPLFKSKPCDEVNLQCG